MIYDFFNSTTKARHAALGATTVSAFNAASDSWGIMGSSLAVFIVTAFTAALSNMVLKSDALDKITNRHSSVVNAIWNPQNRYLLDEKELALKFCACVMGVTAGMATHHEIENMRADDQEQGALYYPSFIEKLRANRDLDVIPAAP